MGLPTSNGNASRLEKRSPVKKGTPLEYDSDIDPDDLLPVYLDSKSKLFQLQQVNPKKLTPRGSSKSLISDTPTDPESSKLLRKIQKIEDDILFDRYVANQQWETKRIQLERDAAARRNAPKISSKDNDNTDLQEYQVDSDDEIS
jgi:ATP-dependent RNA helicase DHX29